ncbi:MAG: ACGX-repeat peptide [Lachnospiraceae bacterium]|nr:ACGX-repeat peptide [Lachnospiraceae bacterium]MDN4742918.1 ACGX-repeat peptide [Lachnospiraceae bacterium C1.1]
MALSNLYGWVNEKAEKAAACGTACGAGDGKPEKKAAACGTACGAGDNK